MSKKLEEALEQAGAAKLLKGGADPIVGRRSGKGRLGPSKTPPGYDEIDRRHEPNYDPFYPRIMLDTKGNTTVQFAPDIAHFPLTLLQPHDRTKGIISTTKNLVTITPTFGEPVVYRVVSYDFDWARFIAERIT